MANKEALDKCTAEQLLERMTIANRANSTHYYDLERFSNYFEHLGTLHKLGALEIKWIDEMLGSSVVDFWEIWKPSVAEERRPNKPKLYENWELIAQKIKRRRSRKGLHRHLRVS